MTVPVADSAAPWPNVAGSLQNATPDSASAQMKVNVGALPNQPLAFGDGPANEIEGADSSIEIGSVVTVVVLPARSLIVRETVCPAPSPNVTATGHEVTPDSASPQVNDTTTSWLNQPFAFGGETNANSVGAVSSMLIASVVTDAVLPARSTTVPVTVCPTPSCSVTGAEHE